MVTHSITCMTVQHILYHYLPKLLICTVFCTETSQKYGCNKQKIGALRSLYSNMKLMLCLIKRLDDHNEEMRKNSKIITSAQH